MEFLDKNNKFTPSLFSIEEPTTKDSQLKKQPRSQRALLLQDFITELDKELGTKWKDKHGAWHKVEKVKPAFIAFKLSHLNTAELYYFLSDCKQAKCGFRKCFFGALKVDKST